MDETSDLAGGSPAPTGCTLPTVQQPLRLAEFDDLFAVGVRSVHHVDRSRVRWELTPEPAVAARAADLMTREVACCSFFTFTLTAAQGALLLEVTVPDEQVEVLGVLADLARAGGRR